MSTEMLITPALPLQLEGSKDGVGNKDADGLDCLAWLPAEAKTVAVKQKGKAQRSVGKVWGK